MRPTPILTRVNAYGFIVLSSNTVVASVDVIGGYVTGKCYDPP